MSNASFDGSIPLEEARPSQPTNRPLRPPLGAPLRQLLAENPKIEVEVGTGKGLFLCGAAQASSDHFFVGVEIAKKYAEMAQARLERLSVPNAKFLWRRRQRRL